MLKQTLRKYPDIVISESFMCGDSESDRLCAVNAGLKLIGINRGEHSICKLSEINKYIYKNPNRMYRAVGIFFCQITISPSL